MGRARAYHHADILGPAGQLLGRVRYALTFKRPAGELVRLARAVAHGSGLEGLELSDPLVQGMLRVGRCAWACPAPASCLAACWVGRACTETGLAHASLAS